MSLSWPPVCACCLAPGTHRVAQEKTRSLFLGVATIRRSLSIDVPYCASCAQHTVWSQSGRMASAVVWSAAVLVGSAFAGALLSILIVEVVPVLVGGAVSRPAGSGGGASSASLLIFPLLSCAMPWVAAGLYFRWRVRSRPRNGSAGHDPKGRPAVELTRFDDHRLTLKVRNPRYAALLTEANPS
jgi:hypothetical protein